MLAAFIVLGSVCLIAMIAYVLAGFAYPVAAYTTALIVNFFTLAFAFVVALDVILREPSLNPPKR